MPLGAGNWAFSGVLGYHVMDLTMADDSLFPELGIDPIQLQAGVSYNF